MLAVWAAVADTATTLEGRLAYALPALFFAYYSVRGWAVTVLYVWVKLRLPKEASTELSIAMGWWGQLGAFVGPCLQILLVQVFDVFGLSSSSTSDIFNVSATGSAAGSATGFLFDSVEH